ncbi:MAG TPA: hypothetical protein VN253_04655, partial [Kofleriaceae bacterium]|nr:hypothetical protein [Kofleriaceae bacterium]
SGELPPDAEPVASNPVDGAAVVPPTVVDARPAASSGTPSDVEVECLRYQTNEKWPDLDSCSERLRQYNPALASELKNRAVKEVQSAPRINGVETALRDKNLKKAEAELKGVWPGSTSYQKIKAKYEAAESTAIAEAIARLDRVNSGDCKEYNQILAQERASKPARVASEAARQVRCTPAAPPPAACDADAFAEKGRELFASGQNSQSLASWEAAYNCRQDPQFAQKAFIVACNLTNIPKAKLFWKRMSPALRQLALGVCVRNGITEDTLSAP